MELALAKVNLFQKTEKVRFATKRERVWLYSKSFELLSMSVIWGIRVHSCHHEYVVVIYSCWEAFAFRCVGIFVGEELQVVHSEG